MSSRAATAFSMGTIFSLSPSKEMRASPAATDWTMPYPNVMWDTVVPGTILAISLAAAFGCAGFAALLGRAFPMERPPLRKALEYGNVA